MHRPPRYRRKAWRRTKPSTQGFKLPWSGSLRSSEGPSARLTRREGITLSILAVAGCVVMILTVQFVGGWKIRRDREHSLAAMQAEYSLTETQLTAIREIEASYHGSDSVFFRPSHTFEEGESHRLFLSQQMSSEAAHRFLDDKTKSFGSISHKH